MSSTRACCSNAAPQSPCQPCEPCQNSRSRPRAGTRAYRRSPERAFDKTVDLVVVGLGGAGAVAAIEAARLGRSVLVLEKTAAGGGNTAVSAGNFIIPADAEKAFEYLSATFALGASEMDAAAVRRFCVEAAATREFFADIAPEAELQVAGHANFPQLPHAETITKYSIKGEATGGINLFAVLKAALKRLSVEVLYETPAEELVVEGFQNADGDIVDAVTGVLARRADGSTLLIGARHGVVLATGGYECDAESLESFCQGAPLFSLGTPANTGDGLRMAQSVNAALWHMHAYSCPLGMRVPGLSSAIPFHPTMAGFIWVDRFGRRFANEADVDLHACLYSVNHFDPVKHCYPAIPCWAVFDEKARTTGGITHQRFGYGAVIEGYAWSRDSSREIEAGIVKKAESIEELAEIIGLDPAALKATVARWNACVREGSDHDFGRRMEKPLTEKASLAGLTPRKLSDTIEEGPFYAVELYPALLNTQGGPRRSERAEVLDRAGHPIPGLYAAGELGSLWGTVYQGSSNVAECLAYGRIAAREALSRPARNLD